MPSGLQPLMHGSLYSRQQAIKSRPWYKNTRFIGFIASAYFRYCGFPVMAWRHAYEVPPNRKCTGRRRGFIIKQQSNSKCNLEKVAARDRRVPMVCDCRKLVAATDCQSLLLRNPDTGHCCSIILFNFGNKAHRMKHYTHYRIERRSKRYRVYTFSTCQPHLCPSTFWHIVSTIGRRSFPVAASILWNSLPPDIQSTSQPPPWPISATDCPVNHFQTFCCNYSYIDSAFVDFVIFLARLDIHIWLHLIDLQ